MPTNIGSKDAFDTLVSTEAVVAVDFWAPWCGPCRNFAPIFEAASEKVGDAAEFVKVNVDDHQEIAQQYGITSIPTVLYFKGGKVADRVTGLESESKIVTRINEMTV